MHELAIAQAIADVALRHAHGRRVACVEVRIGALRQVVPDALTFAFGLVSDGAQLQIEHVPAAGRCRTCGAWSALPDFPLRCATCGSTDVDVQAGEELCVDALELEETEEAIHGIHV